MKQTELDESLFDIFFFPFSFYFFLTRLFSAEFLSHSVRILTSY